MKLFYLIIAVIYYQISYSQDIDATGELEWNEEQEFAIFRTEYPKKNHPNLPRKSKDLSFLIPPAGEQGTQGSCWAWATTYAIRSAMENPGKKDFYFDAQGKLDISKVLVQLSHISTIREIRMIVILVIFQLKYLIIC